jgi:hypothetical protein
MVQIPTSPPPGASEFMVVVTWKLLISSMSLFGFLWVLEDFRGARGDVSLGRMVGALVGASGTGLT